MNKLLIILLFLILNVINSNRVRIYERIERNYVAEKVFNFLNENIDDLRLFNFFLKNKKVLNSLKLDFLYHNIYI